MSDEPFVDYYEVLQVSPNADDDTISRVFRHLAKRYHPDNPSTGNTDLFTQLMQAQEVLTSPERRAAYDLLHQRHWTKQWRVAGEAGFDGSVADDRAVREQILSLLYVQRRREPHNPGMGNLSLAKILSCPIEHIEFHLWYLHGKGWILRTDSGTFAITPDGVDQAEVSRLGLQPERLIAERSTS